MKKEDANTWYFHPCVKKINRKNSTIALHVGRSRIDDVFRVSSLNRFK